MPEPLSLSDARSRRAETAFQAFKIASEKAQRTLRFEDADVAGHAWRTFLNLYLTGPELQRFSSSCERGPGR